MKNIIKAIHGNVLLKKIEIEQSSGGIIVPDIGKEGTGMGEVLSVGPGWVTIAGEIIKPTLKVGDKVYYPTFGGQKLTVNSEDYLIFKDTDILATVE